MSYDLRIGVRVYGAEDKIVAIDRPEYDSPTYNLRDMFVACMDWDYTQGEWYNVAEVLPLIKHGIDELKYNGKEYRKYNAPNGWGTVGQALNVLLSLEKCIIKNSDIESDEWSENEIPIELMYVRW